MSTSQHPIALRLEGLVGGSALLLATVMWLPLLDGIFPTLVLAGALDSTAGIIQTGLLIFGGSATVAVLLAELDGSPRSSIKTVLIVGLPLIVVAGLQAALAPTLDSMLSPVFERFAAVVILAIAAKTASARIGEILPRPGVIIGLGLVASFEPSGMTLTFVSDPSMVLRGVAAAAVGVAFALAVAATGPYLREAVHLDRFRFGSAVALGFLPLTFFELPVWEFAPLAVLALTTLFALDPGTDDEDTASATAGGADHPLASDRQPNSDPEPVGSGRGIAVGADQHVTDGGDPTADPSDHNSAADDEPRYPQEREPWL